MRHVPLVLLCSLLAVSTAACCCGGALPGMSPEPAWVRHRLDPHGLSLELPPTWTQQPGALVFTSGDHSDTLRVVSAPAGLPAQARGPSTLAIPGTDVAAIVWSRPRNLGTLAAQEARITGNAPVPMVHWVLLVDGPHGPVLVQSSVEARFITAPSTGDAIWERIVTSVHAEP